MLRLFLFALFAALAGVAQAEDARLKRLATGDDSRGWEAVGRLDIDGNRFCTGALIAPDLVLTAAHCLFEKDSGARIAHEKIEFRAGWREGRASAYRGVRRAVVHPEYSYSARLDAARVGNDVALLQLHHPIRNTRVVPFETDRQPGKGDRVGVVSYALNRSEAPSMQDVCRVKDWQTGVLVMTCVVDFGASGAPVFSFDAAGKPRIVSVVSGMAVVDGERVSLGTKLEGPLTLLRAELASSSGMFSSATRTRTKRVRVGARSDTGAKFIKP